MHFLKQLAFEEAVEQHVISSLRRKVDVAVAQAELRRGLREAVRDPGELEDTSCHD